MKLRELLKVLLLPVCCLFTNTPLAQEVDSLRVIEVPFNKDLILDLPVDSELKLWESGIYFWYIQKLLLTPENDKVFKIAPHNLDIVISEAPKSNFDYAVWRKHLEDDGVEIIEESPAGVLYISPENVLQILTYYYTGNEHILGKATLFDTENLAKAKAMLEVLSSFHPQREQRKFTSLFNIANELQTKKAAKDSPLANELREQIQKNLSKERLLSADTLDGFWVDFNGLTETIDIFPELETDTLENLSDDAEQYGWDIRYYQKYVPRKQSGSLVMQSKTNPMSFITYCLFHDSGLNLLMAIPSTTSVSKQLDIAHQCNHLSSAESLHWMNQDWLSKLFSYKRVKQMEAPAGWFTVFDGNNNPDDYFFGAAGVLDSEGKVVIPNRFEEIRWVDGYFVGQSKLGKELLNMSGESLLIAEDFRLVGEDIYFVWEDGNQQGLFDLKNKAWIIPLAEQNIDLWGNSGLFTFQKVIKSTPTSIRYGKTGLLDGKGQVLLQDDFDHFWFNSELNVIVAQRRTLSGSRSSYRYGIFDMKGQQLVPLDYDHVLNEQGAIINLRKDGLWYEYPAQ